MIQFRLKLKNSYQGVECLCKSIIQGNKSIHEIKVHRFNFNITSLTTHFSLLKYAWEMWALKHLFSENLTYMCST